MSSSPPFHLKSKKLGLLDVWARWRACLCSWRGESLDPLWLVSPVSFRAFRSLVGCGCWYPRPPRAAKGQALVLFALSVVTLLMLVGLSIDGLRVYIAFAQAERAAEAAALAGVAYLPQYPTVATPAPDGSDATSQALQVAAQNGFGDASAISVTSQVNPVPALTVTIHINVPVSLVALIDPAPATTLATATAEILPPVALGDSTGAFGDKPENIGQQVAALASPYELKERGDPYSVQCETGWSDGADTLHADAATNIYTTSQLSIGTNAPQYASGPNCSPGTPGNPDQIPSGFGGLATRTGPVPTGASYLITIPAGGSGYSVWVWNPRFVYTGTNRNDQLFTTENIYSTGMTDNPAFYPQLAYTLFSVPLLYQRNADVPLAALWPAATPPDTTPNAPLPPTQITTLPSLDAAPNDLAAHGCPSAGTWNVQSGAGSSYQQPIAYGVGCQSALPPDYMQWVRVGSNVPAAPANAPAYYRLTVDTSAGYGVHGYAVKVCRNATTTADDCATGGATITPWNAATVMLQGGSSQMYPLANIPASYAGRQIALGLFNPGLGAGAVALRIVPPAAGGSVTYPTWARMTTVSGMPAIQTSLNGDDLYHGKWVRLTLTLPPDYAGGEWQIAWNGTYAPPTTLMTVSAALIGSPIMLVS